MNSTSSLSFLDKWKSSQAYQKGIAGTCAVATTATIMFPFDLIKNRLQYQKSNNIKYTGVLNAFKIIIKEETIFGLFSKPISSEEREVQDSFLDAYRSGNYA